MFSISSFCFLSLLCFMPENEKSDHERIQGIWKCTKFERLGSEDRAFLDRPVVITESKITIDTEFEDYTILFELDRRIEPKQINWKQHFGFFDDEAMITLKGIYILAGDTLMICVPVQSTGARPKVFQSTKTNGNALIMFSRIPK